MIVYKNAFGVVWVHVKFALSAVTSSFSLSGAVIFFCSSVWIDIPLLLSGAVTCDPVRLFCWNHCSCCLSRAQKISPLWLLSTIWQCRDLLMDCSEKNGRHFCRLPVSLSINQTCRGRRGWRRVFNALSCEDAAEAVIDYQRWSSNLNNPVS